MNKKPMNKMRHPVHKGNGAYKKSDQYHIIALPKNGCGDSADCHQSINDETREKTVFVTAECGSKHCRIYVCTGEQEPDMPSSCYRSEVLYDKYYTQSEDDGARGEPYNEEDGDNSSSSSSYTLIPSPTPNLRRFPLPLVRPESEQLGNDKYVGKRPGSACFFVLGSEDGQQIDEHTAYDSDPSPPRPATAPIPSQAPRSEKNVGPVRQPKGKKNYKNVKPRVSTRWKYHIPPVFMLPGETSLYNSKGEKVGTSIPNLVYNARVESPTFRYYGDVQPQITTSDKSVQTDEFVRKPPQRPTLQRINPIPRLMKVQKIVPSQTAAPSPRSTPDKKISSPVPPRSTVVSRCSTTPRNTLLPRSVRLSRNAPPAHTCELPPPQRKVPVKTRAPTPRKSPARTPAPRIPTTTRTTAPSTRSAPPETRTCVNSQTRSAPPETRTCANSQTRSTRIISKPTNKTVGPDRPSSIPSRQSSVSTTTTTAAATIQVKRPASTTSSTAPGGTCKRAVKNPQPSPSPSTTTKRQLPMKVILPQNVRRPDSYKYQRLSRLKPGTVNQPVVKRQQNQQQQHKDRKSVVTDQSRCVHKTNKNVGGDHKPQAIQLQCSTCVSTTDEHYTVTPCESSSEAKDSDDQYRLRKSRYCTACNENSNYDYYHGDKLQDRLQREIDTMYNNPDE